MAATENKRMPTVNYWRMSFRIGSEGPEMWPECRDRGIAAMGAYAEDGTPVVRDCSGLTEEQLTQAFRKKKPGNSARLFSFKNLVYRMELGDIIYAKQGPWIVGRGRIRSRYKYDPEIMKGSEARWEHYVQVDWDKGFEPVPILLGAEPFTILPLPQEKVRLLEAAIMARAPQKLQAAPGPEARKMRKELATVYRSLQRKLSRDPRRFRGLQGPDLIWIDDEYFRAQPRIAIVGQQVRKWYTYREFIELRRPVAKCLQEHRQAFEGHRRGAPFWQFFQQVGRVAFPGEDEAWRKVLWTNLVKFVCAGEVPVLKKPFAEEAIRLQEGLLATELRIAEPEICLFVTGPDYDYILDRYFPGISYQPLGRSDCGFARLQHNLLPEKSYRTYHPNYLRRAGLWEPVFRILRRELGWSTRPQRN